jgi:hypothetical protein
MNPFRNCSWLEAPLLFKESDFKRFSMKAKKSVKSFHSLRRSIVLKYNNSNILKADVAAVVYDGREGTLPEEAQVDRKWMILRSSVLGITSDRRAPPGESCRSRKHEKSAGLSSDMKPRNV